MKIKSKNVGQNYLKNVKNHKKGFTLIELLVAILIVAILAMIAIPQYINATDRAKLSQLLIATTAIAKAQERYYMQRDEYATNLENLDITIANGKFEKDYKGNTTRIKFDWGSCSLTSKYSTTRTLPSCHLNNPRVGYMIIYETNNSAPYQQCTAETSSTRAMKLCRSVMPNAKETYSASGYCSYPCTKFRY